MSAVRRTGTCWSDETWIRIFVKIPEPEGVTCGSDVRLSRVDVRRLQSDIHSYNRLKLQLRRVCKRFRNLVDQHPPVSTSLAISEDLSGNLPSLIQFLRRQGNYIRQFVASCNNPTADSAAAALLSSTSELKTAIILNTSSNMISLLSGFHSLTSCDLRTAQGEVLNLAPLGILPNLNNLQISDGTFVNLSPLNHLSALMLWQAALTAHWPPISNLQRLSLATSAWYDLGFGLTACTALRSLQCLVSLLGTSHQEHSLDLRHPVAHLPNSFTTMTQLTELSLEFKCFSQGAHDVWIYKLCNLVDLKLKFCCPNQHVKQILPEMTWLSRLESVSVEVGERAQLVLQVPWKNLSVLRKAVFYAGSIRVTEHILGLSQLEGLQSLNFDCHIVDPASALLLRSLLVELAVCCPHVQCSLSGNFVSQVQWQLGNIALRTRRAVRNASVRG